MRVQRLRSSQVEPFHHGFEIVGQGIEILAIHGLGRTAMATRVTSD
jgi:hypothetical protein